MLWHRQAIFESKGDKLSSPAECKIRSCEVWDTKSPTDGMITHKPTGLSEMKRNLNSIARPYDERALSPLDFTAGWFRTWLWRYRCVLLLILMLWHRQAIFGLKGDKLSSPAEYKIRTGEVRDNKLPVDWMPTHKPTELSRIKLNLNSMQFQDTFISIVRRGVKYISWKIEYLLFWNLNESFFHYIKGRGGGGGGAIFRHSVSQILWQILRFLLFFIKSHVWIESIHPSIDPPTHPSILYTYMTHAQPK